MRKGFTFVEIIFVIAILGILSSIAIPKMLNTTDMADIASAKSTLSSVRMALSNERHKRIIFGDFTPITSLSSGGKPFDFFSKNKRGVANIVLPYSNSSYWNLLKDTSNSSTYKESYLFSYGNNQSCTFFLENNFFKGDCSILNSSL